MGLQGANFSFKKSPVSYGLWWAGKQIGSHEFESYFPCKKREEKIPSVFSALKVPQIPSIWIDMVIKGHLLTIVLLSLDIPCLCKQCRSRSIGFFRSQLIWICTVCHQVCEFIATIRTTPSDWLKIRSRCGIFIYSAGQGLRLWKYVLDFQFGIL